MVGNMIKIIFEGFFGFLKTLIQIIPDLNEIYNLPTTIMAAIFGVPTIVISIVGFLISLVKKNK